MDYILIGLALIGLLPLVIILYRKYSNDKLRKSGVTTNAIVRNVYGVSIRGLNAVGVEYRIIETGEVMTKNIRVAGVPYTVGDELPILYDPKNPKRMQVDMKIGYLPMLIFTIIIAAFIIFACFKLKEMMNNGSM